LASEQQLFKIKLKKIDRVQELRTKLSDERRELASLEEWFDEEGLLALEHISDLEDDLQYALEKDRIEREERKKAGIKPKLAEEMPMAARLQLAIQQRYAPFSDDQRKLFPKIRVLRRDIERTNGQLKTLLKSITA